MNRNKRKLVIFEKSMAMFSIDRGIQIENHFIRLSQFISFAKLFVITGRIFLSVLIKLRLYYSSVKCLPFAPECQFIFIVKLCKTSKSQKKCYKFRLFIIFFLISRSLLTLILYYLFIYNYTRNEI